MPTLRELRLARLLTQRELARAAGLTQKTIVDLELSRVEPHQLTMRKIAAALDVDPLAIEEFHQAIVKKVAA